MKQTLLAAALLTVSLTPTTAQQAPASPPGPSLLPNLRRVCSSTRSTRPPTRAPTSISSPAAAGCQEPGAARPRELGPLRRAAGAQQRDAAQDSRGCRAPAPIRRRKKIGDYYASCMDEAAIDANGAAPLDPLLKKIAALSSVNALAAARRRAAHDRRQRLLSVRRAGDFKDASTRNGDRSTRAGSACPIATTTSADDAKSMDLRQAVRRARRQDVGAGRRAAGAGRSGGSDQVMTLRDRAGEERARRGPRRDPNKVYHKMSHAELQALTPQFQWARYFTGIGSPPIYAINVAEPDFVKAFGQVLAATPLDRDQGLPALARRARVGRRAAEAVRRRELPLLRHRR